MYHKIILVGNLGQDPEMRYLPTGTPVTNLNVATNEAWTGQDGEKHERTTWWRVAVFGKQAEACNTYLAKGRQVFIEGRVNPDPKTGGPRTYERKDGSVGASYEVTAQNVRFLGGANGAKPAETPVTGEDSEIPF